MTLFEKAFNIVLELEGGVSNHKMDPGGLTKWGVTQRVYDNWRTNQGLVTQSVVLMTTEECKSIYHSYYWVKGSCDKLVGSAAIVHFDAAVNTGISRANKLLQQVVNVSVDGIIGPNTLKAAASYDEIDLVNDLLWERLEFYTGLKTYNVFGKGWTKRLLRLRKEL